MNNNTAGQAKDLLSSFAHRHIGPDYYNSKEMLAVLGLNSMDELLSQTIPQQIRLSKDLDIPESLTEAEYLDHIQKIADKNKDFQSFIGLGYYNSITPSVIQRNVLENPGWYTQYTPYQSEISQGRLEALLNFQTMICDLTGMELANSSLLDEGTSAAEAMRLLLNVYKKKSKDQVINKFYVSDLCFPQTQEVLLSRSEPLGIELIICPPEEFDLNDEVFGILLQYPGQDGSIADYSEISHKAKEAGIGVAVASDLMALTMLKPPGEWGADIVFGNSQRFGIPLGYGGPHAAFFATHEKYKRYIPGRIIGVSEDKHGNAALRMALQTREQHIKRERATSNICTAQALLANMAGFYAVYHGPDGLLNIAKRINNLTCDLANKLLALNLPVCSDSYFDTIQLELQKAQVIKLRKLTLENGFNLRYQRENRIGISLDETCTAETVDKIVSVFEILLDHKLHLNQINTEKKSSIPKKLERESSFMEHPVFNQYHSETEMMRYIKRLENKDLSLTHSMIPLGSCTMKLNAATQLFPLSWKEFNQVHPFAPTDQAAGYTMVFDSLEKYLAEITGFDACSLQPNSGAQGEFAGLMVIREFHKINEPEKNRNIVLIPSSAHGTNPASAIMSGMKVVVVKCDESGNIDLLDLSEKANKHAENLAALMITYPSTHGVFEEKIKEVTAIIHNLGAKVYMDGANMNAQTGLTNPGIIGADVCHLNLHKTFAIPHGGGGPGMGPICCTKELEPFLPSHRFIKNSSDHSEKAKNIPAIASAPWGSASILLISYAYIRLLGAQGLKEATQMAILNANYIKARLENHFDILYSGENGRIGHELILDLRPYKKNHNITVEDIAKRLMDYGFHAPTVSFPVPGTMMIEPTESEALEELNRFCEAMANIKQEIDEIAEGRFDPEDNVLKNAPHTIGILCGDEWLHSYTREKAAFPLPWIKERKFWPDKSRISNSIGDRNLFCTCPPVSDFEIVDN